MRNGITISTDSQLKRALRRLSSFAAGFHRAGWRARGFATGGMLATVLLAGGCASQRHCPPPPETPEKPAGFPCGPCAGYFPTCWRPWPDVCPSCPVFGLEEPAPAEAPVESVPLPPTFGEPTVPEGSLESPESEVPPGEAAPSANDRARAPAMHHGRPTSRRVVRDLPDWQLPPLPDSEQMPASQESLTADEERPVRTPRVIRASQHGEPAIKRADR